MPLLFHLPPDWGLAASHRVVPTRADEHPTQKNQADAGQGEKAVVPHGHAEPLDDVVNLQEVVVNHALDEVEEAEAQDEGAEEGPRGPRDIAPPPGPPEESQ